MDKYFEFLKKKIAIAKDYGFEINDSDLHPVLMPHQRDIVKWAIKGGKRAIFASFGLGKSVMQLEICKQIIKREGGKALIICPLGVKQEFVHDAENLLQIKIEYVRNQNEILNSKLDI